MSTAPRWNGKPAIARTRTIDLATDVEQAVDRVCRYLFNRQNAAGYWVGELEADTTLESDYVALQLWLYPPAADGSWNPPTCRRVAAACCRILESQLPAGGWNIYAGGPANVSASVKAYFALKLAGFHANDGRMRRARAKIRDLGGVEATNSYTKIYLSYFGLYPRSKIPSIPPEIFLLPQNNRFGVYGMSSWSRAILAPLSILSAKKALRAVPRGFHIEEIFSGVEPELAERLSWKQFFLLVDKGLKLWEASGIRTDRRKAIDAAAEWMFARLKESDGLGAIYPAMMNSIMALTELGFDRGDPGLEREIERFDALILEDEEGFRVQPCHSPVWDTAMTVFALGSAKDEIEEPARWALARAADWLVSKQVRKKGDWSVKKPQAEPGGWYFEHANEFYPDTDDTAKVLLALALVDGNNAQRQRNAERRAVDWLTAMQSSDGGWAAFDADNNAEILTHVPFADHNAMLDPTCADITGRVVEALSRRAPDRCRVAIRRGVDYLLRNQEEDGSWYGRWGVNYLYGTCFALRGLRAAGEDPREAHMIRAGEWVRSVQKNDGGWGETAASYDDPARKTEGVSTASQTAWALMALFATDDYETDSVKSGIRYLIENQNENGSWNEQFFTGTGFPRVFYLRYHLYPQYFPLMALGEYRRRGSLGA